ncbi:cadmium resistance transporter [Eupransor demetentiae]|uniref:Predicted permease (CadD) n=1 Tax=Eupransor demetentiae TaxID=3109584 RepID=A0ABP0EU65_9LACO|nr:Cadmium resistance protein CadD [Lactobacillaceae bacterium LMG 33000]
MNIGLLTLTFFAVNLDFFIMLLFLLKKYPFRSVLLAYLVGNILLMTLSFGAGQILETFMPEWLLGILGLIPIYLALRDDDDEEGGSRASSPFLAVLGTYLSVCAGCNLSIFLPVLLGESLATFGETILYIGALTIIIVFILKRVNQNKWVTATIDKYGEKLMRICYILIGLYVLYDSGFLAHVFAWISHFL